MDHHKDLVLACAPKSPWKIAVNTSVSGLVVGGDDDSSSATDAADSDYWPALNDVQSKSTKGGFDDSRSNKLQQKPGTVSEVGVARRNQSAVLGCQHYSVTNAFYSAVSGDCNTGSSYSKREERLIV